ncbi:polynucleotide kinase [Caudoviricetes sp.]|nr:polynucleotide kinase [Caudoviricetes sp.]
MKLAKPEILNMKEQLSQTSSLFVTGATRKKKTVTSYSAPPYNPELPDCIIVDIDGTLAHMTDRSPYDYSKVSTDVVDVTVAGIVQKYYQRDIQDLPDVYIIIVSGREDGCKAETVQWLSDHSIKYDEIHMRKHGDNRDDRIVKKEIYEEFIKPRFNVRFVLDDRDRVVKMWREEGLKVLQVAEGDF